MHFLGQQQPGLVVRRASSQTDHRRTEAIVLCYSCPEGRLIKSALMTRLKMLFKSRFSTWLSVTVCILWRVRGGLAGLSKEYHLFFKTWKLRGRYGVAFFGESFSRVDVDWFGKKFHGLFSEVSLCICFWHKSYEQQEICSACLIH